MGFTKAQEDRPTPSEVYGWRIYLQAIAISFGALTFGYDSAFFGVAISRKGFKDTFGITVMLPADQTATSGNLTSSFQAAAFFGSLFTWLYMERFGRKSTLLLSSLIFCVGALIMTVATDQLSMIYAGRAITGLAVGGITAVVPAYIAELSPPAIRGVLVGMFEIAYQIGSVIGFWINYGITQTISPTTANSWRIPMAVQLIPGGLLAIGSYFLLESPPFLLRKGKYELALKNLTYLRQLPEEHQYIQEELEMIRARQAQEDAIAGEEKGTMGYVKGAFRLLAMPGMRNRMGLVFMMFLLQNFSGANAINYYSATLFGSVGVTDVALYTGIYGLVKAISSIIFFGFLIDAFGRRKPWLLSAGLCAVCLTFVGVYVKVGHPADQAAAALSESTKQGGKAAIAMIMLFSAFWAFGGNGLPWIVSAEIFPISLRSLTGAYASMCQWLSQFAITKATPNLFITMQWGVWLFFAGCCFLTVVFTFFFVPETKGIPIEQMDKIFGFKHSGMHGIPHTAQTGLHALDDHKSTSSNEERKDGDLYKETV